MRWQGGREEGTSGPLLPPATPRERSALRGRARAGGGAQAPLFPLVAARALTTTYDDEGEDDDDDDDDVHDDKDWRL